MTGLRLAWRFLRRDLAAGEVQVLLAALALAVMAVTAVAFVSERAERALALEANRLLGGDVVVRGDARIGPQPRQWADQLGLRQSETWAFPSMLRSSAGLRLSEVRALGEGYPLRGHYRIDAGQGERQAGTIPAPGTVWLTRSGAQALGVGLGDEVMLGRSHFRIAALVLHEPDAAVDVFSIAPRVFVRLDEIEATGLIQPGSRIAYRLVVAGEKDRAQDFVEKLGGRLERGQRLETVADARPEVRRALEQADRFLGLAALVAVVVAAIALAMAARRHSARHLDGCAVMRCLGASQRLIAAVHVGELLLLGLLGTGLGVFGAFVIQHLLSAWLERLMGMAIPAAGLLPALQGLAVGFVVLLTFAVPPVLALRHTPALRVLRRDPGGLELRTTLVLLLGLGAIAGLLWWRAGSAVLALSLLGGMAVTFPLLALLALALVALLQRLRGHLHGPWRYGLANVGRRRAAAVAQIAALGLGLMAILLLTLVRTDLMARWQQSVPVDAPNRFIVNVQPGQYEGVRAILAQHDASAPDLFPMVRARLVSVNGQAVDARSYAARGERAQRLAEREFNLSAMASLRASDNRVVAGRFWDADETAAQLSVEQGMAREFGWKLGDVIGFDIAGSRFEAPVTSLRRVEWESFRPNFFVLAPPQALRGHAASHVGAARVPQGDAALTRALVEAYPNLSVVDVDAVIAQVMATADQVATAVEHVFLFTLLAGVLVLLSAISASQDERLLEAAVMRVLGASRLQLRLAHASEFIALGALAGSVAALAASLVSGLIAVQVFEQAWAPDWRVAALGAGLGVLIVTLAGLAATARIARQPPSRSLQALGG